MPSGSASTSTEWSCPTRPGTCAPNPGGLTGYEALEAVWQIGQHPKCRGMDILEVSPPLDVQGLTSLTASQLAMNFIGATKVRLQNPIATAHGA